MLKSWLPPKVWFHGGQSSSTGGSSVRKGSTEAIMRWLAHIMRCVLMTALGLPVEPDVKRNLAMLSGVTAACAASTTGPMAACRSLNNVALRPGGASRVTTSSVSAGNTAAMARANTLPLAANTRPGCSRSNMKRSFSKSFETSE